MIIILTENFNLIKIFASFAAPTPNTDGFYKKFLEKGFKICNKQTSSQIFTWKFTVKFQNFSSVWGGEGGRYIFTVLDLYYESWYLFWVMHAFSHFFWFLSTLPRNDKSYNIQVSSGIG